MRFTPKTLARSAASGALLLAGLASGPLPAAAAIDSSGPDLSLSMTESATQVNSGRPLTYTLTIRNTPILERTCELNALGKPFCYNDVVAGGPVSGVDLTDTLPAGATFQSYSANSGFTCGAAAGVVTCTNGSLGMSGVATITLSINAPSLAPGGANVSIVNSATVNPSQRIDERSYANNSASISATVLAPPALPDLVVTDFSGGGYVPRGGQATYTVTIANIGQAAAAGVAVLIDGGTSDFTIVSSSGTPGFVPCYNSPERFSMRAWCPGIGQGPTLAAGATATMTILVQMPSTYTGTRTMSAQVDPYNTISESNEANNANTQTVITSVY